MKTKELIEAVKNERGSAFQNCRDCTYGTHNEEVIEKLTRFAELEDKIEQGTLIELPCKVGDTVYIVYTASGIDGWEVTSIQICKRDTIFRLGHTGTEDYNAVFLKEINDVWFLTREEAEKRLLELQGDK